MIVVYAIFLLLVHDFNLLLYNVYRVCHTFAQHFWRHAAIYGKIKLAIIRRGWPRAGVKLGFWSNICTGVSRYLFDTFVEIVCDIVLTLLRVLYDQVHVCTICNGLYYNISTTPLIRLSRPKSYESRNCRTVVGNSRRLIWGGQNTRAHATLGDNVYDSWTTVARQCTGKMWDLYEKSHAPFEWWVLVTMFNTLKFSKALPDKMRDMPAFVRLHSTYSDMPSTFLWHVTNFKPDASRRDSWQSTRPFSFAVFSSQWHWYLFVAHHWSTKRYRKKTNTMDDIKYNVTASGKQKPNTTLF